MREGEGIQVNRLAVLAGGERRGGKKRVPAIS